MILASAINNKINLFTGILIGALFVVATSQICQNKKHSFRTVKQPEDKTEN